MESKKSNKIKEIVRLQQMLKKWRKLAVSSRTSSGGASTASGAATMTRNSSGGSKSIRFLKRTLSLSESSVRESSSNVVRKGYLAVAVGEELKRFIIPTEYLGHPAFHILLREAEEEFGFEQTGVLRIPCEVAVFQIILKMLEGKKDVPFMNECRFGADDMRGHCSSRNLQTPLHHPLSPMCR